jgi:hypothetical protein
MTGTHLNLRGNRAPGPLSPEQRARWWLRSGTGHVNDAVKLLRSEGIDDERIQSEFGQDILAARRRELKVKGYSDDEVSEIIRSGDIFGRMDPIKRMLIHSAIVLKHDQSQDRLSKKEPKCRVTRVRYLGIPKSHLSPKLLHGTA